MPGPAFLALLFLNLFQSYTALTPLAVQNVAQILVGLLFVLLIELEALLAELDMTLLLFLRVLVLVLRLEDEALERASSIGSGLMSTFGRLELFIPPFSLTELVNLGR